MPYESTVTFTLDTICPWTYLGLVRLLKALEQYRTAHPDSPASFTLKYSSYQLYPDHPMPPESLDKHEWYMNKRYQSSEALMSKYESLMRMYFAAESLSLNPNGPIANTLPSHRLIHYAQETLSLSESRVTTLVRALYRMYFEEAKPPSAIETLVQAAEEAGIEEKDVRALIEGDGKEDEVKEMIRENARDGVDSVPHVVVEGRKRDFTLTGAKEVEEYFKALDQVSKECS